MGPNREEFVIHKALLCHHSPYFRSALNSNFIEAQNNAIELKDEDPEWFQYIAAWMYRGTFGQSRYDHANTQEEAIALCTQACEIYYLADFLRIEKLLVQLLSYLHGLFDRFQEKRIVPLNSAVIIHVYKNTTEASELRATITDELVRVWCDLSCDVDVKDFDMCINHVEGMATTLVTGMRKNWLVERTEANLRARMSPTLFLNRLAPDVAPRTRNRVVAAPVSRPAAAPPLPRHAAAAPVSGPAAHAPRPAVTAHVRPPAVTAVPADPGRYRSTAPNAWDCMFCGVNVSDTMSTLVQAVVQGKGPARRCCQKCHAVHVQVRRPGR